MERFRWKAVAIYRSREQGSICEVHEVEEIKDLQQLIELGPHWGALEQIIITHAFTDNPELTVEEAAEL